MATLTNADRDRLRKLQDRWLARKCDLVQYTAIGPDRPIFPGGPTMRQIRECLCPAWESWFRDDLMTDDR